MQIAILGAGNIGSTLAHHFVAADHEVVIANSRDPETLTDLIDELGANAGAATVDETATFGEVVVEAIPFGRYADLPAKALAGKIVVSASNYYPGRDGEIDLRGVTQTELVARHLAESTVVKAFNTMYWETLREEARPDAPLDDRLAIFLAGDDQDAKELVSDLLAEIGFAPIDTGSLAVGGALQEPGSEIYNEPMTAPEARRTLAEIDSE